MSEPFIRLQNVAKTYVTRDGYILAVDDVSFGIQEAEFIAVVGPSGCGKTTMLKMVAGLVPYTGGEITIAGERVDRPQTNLGIIFQDSVLLDWRNVLGNVLIQIDIRGLDKAK